MEQNGLPDKASVIRLLLETEGRAMLCLDATQKGVDVPRRFGNDCGLMLVFNREMPQPIHILPDSIASELRFGGVPHYCVIPYTALWSVFNPDTQHGMIWPDSMPKNIPKTHGGLQVSIRTLSSNQAAPPPEEALTEPDPQDQDERPPASERPGPPFLRVIEGGGKETQAETSEAKKRKPNLRLVE